MTILETLPLSLVPGPEQEDAGGRGLPWGRILSATVALTLCTGIAVAHALSPEGPSLQASITLIVFVLAVWAWAFTRLDDTYVSLGAGTALVLSGSLSPPRSCSPASGMTRSGCSWPPSSSPWGSRPRA
ncbi:hypothetical protein NSA19_10465 [Actinomyces bowdenii]|uniref:hypothetical protein n=1 Tax=Actinomyces bowdenii TaxID=131109 RepID=UPI00214B2F03|nr:hypothetical protein [Actinomyces bowdenii]MCR2053251.1 hypothetical protein [Actinomyces bowdenii]